MQMSKMGPWPGVIARAQPIIDRFYLALVFGANDYRIYLRKDGLYYLLGKRSTETWVAGDIVGLEAGGVEPRATDVAPKRESGFDLHGYDREPCWRQPRDRDLFTVRRSSSD